MNAIVKSSGGMLANLAGRYEMDPQEFETTLARTVMPRETTPEEFVAFLMVCNTYTLNPILREIYAFPKKGGGIVPVVSIDGWIRLVNQHPDFEGAEWDAHIDESGKLTAYTCRMFRKDRKMPVVVTEYLSECKRDTDPWKMQHRMLRHKSFIQCARYAFGFSGIYDDDEGRDMSDALPNSPAARGPLPKPPVTKPAEVIEDATVRDVTAKPVADQVKEVVEERRAAQQDEKPADEARDEATAKAVAAAASRKRKPNGWPALFEQALFVVEEGIVTKDVNDETGETIGKPVDPKDLPDADLVLENNVVTVNRSADAPAKQQKPAETKASGPSVEDLMAKFKAGFDHCDSRDSLAAAALAFEDEFKTLKGDDEKASIALYREAEKRIIADEAAGQQDDPNHFPGDPKPAEQTKAAEAEPKAAAPAEERPLPDDPKKMTGEEYKRYCYAYIDAATDGDALKSKWLLEGNIRGGMVDSDELTIKERDAMRAAYLAKKEELEEAKSG